MNHAASSRPTVATLSAAAGLSFALIFLAGCSGGPAHRPSEDAKRNDKKGDPWEAAARQFRQDTTAGGCKAALDQLAGELTNRPDLTGPPPLTPEAEKALAAVVPLAPPDLEEIRQLSYGGLDAAYLADCFYLRDAARSLDLPGGSPAKQVGFAFDWVCRQIYLNPWRLPASPGLDLTVVVPPTFALRRGSGSDLDRAYAFLALLQQMGFDACLIGPPDAAEKSAVPRFLSSAKEPTRGPFWAVGVRVGADVLLFEPWRGTPFPGTLAQVKANPDLLKPWREDKADPWAISADEVTKAAVFLAVPVSSLSSRMTMLDDKLKADAGVRLAVDPAALRDRFLAAPPNGPGLPAAGVKFWNPPTDRFAYARVLSTFLPVSEGGSDRDQEGGRLYDRYLVEQVPRSVFALPPELREREPRERLIAAAFLTYKGTFLDPPSPRERLQRGQFQDAARYLTEKADGFKLGLERLKSADPAEVAEWCKAADGLYAGLGRARLDNDPVAVATAQATLDRFWAVPSPTAQLIIDRSSAQVGLAEASYLMALAKHEEAERTQARIAAATGAEADRAKADAARAWREAADLWAGYLRNHTAAQAGFPGRAAHAQALADRATKLST